MTEKAAPKGAYGGNISCLVRENCSQIFFVYAGGLGMIEGMGPMAFLQKSGIADRNIAFVRDPHVRFFDLGICEELPDLDSVVDWHWQHLAANPHIKDVYCVGNSFGGWAALFMGYLLGAKKVWSLAPAGHWGCRLLMDLMVESNGVTDYDIFYSSQVPDDKLFAENLQGYPGVNLIQDDAHGHLIIRGLMQTGELPKLFPPFQASSPVTAKAGA